MLRKILFSFIILFFAAVVPPSVNAQALFEQREQTFLPGNIIYEFNRQVTNNGLLDVHILTVPLWNPYVTVRPVESARELGTRDTTLNMLRDAGAVAGINADFFPMAAGHIHALGPTVADGRVRTLSTAHNQSGNDFASFIIDNNGTAMFRYLRPQIVFLVDGRPTMDISYINHITYLGTPTIITREGAENTAQLNARQPNLVAVMVRDGIVQWVSTPGQVITVPDDGFLVVMPVQTAAWHRVEELWVDRPAKFLVLSNTEGLQFSDIDTTIGGGGLILHSGQVVHGGTIIGGRHPRSAIGVSMDRQHLILMTVDGRNHSVGATHEEMAALLRRYGAFDAMHFDGGGSTTMAVQEPGSPMRIVNTPSEGSARRVANSLGVFDSSVPGPPIQLILTPYTREIALGDTLTLGVYGFCANRHRIAINPAAVQYRAYIVGADGWTPAPNNWLGSSYMTDRTGALLIVAQYGELVVQEIFMVNDAAAFGQNIQFADPIRTAMTELMPGLAHDFGVRFPAPAQYFARREGSAAIISMTAANGGIMAADPNQWARLAADTAGAEFVIVQLDTLNFNSTQEAALFHDTIAGFAEDGRMVFVVTNNAESPTFSMRGGVRYIDLGQTANMINFRMIDGQIWYDF